MNSTNDNNYKQTLSNDELIDIIIKYDKNFKLPNNFLKITTEELKEVEHKIESYNHMPQIIKTNKETLNLILIQYREIRTQCIEIKKIMKILEESEREIKMAKEDNMQFSESKKILKERILNNFSHCMKNFKEVTSISLDSNNQTFSQDSIDFEGVDEIVGKTNQLLGKLLQDLEKELENESIECIDFDERIFKLFEENVNKLKKINELYQNFNRKQKIEIDDENKRLEELKNNKKKDDIDTQIFDLKNEIKLKQEKLTKKEEVYLNLKKIYMQSKREEEEKRLKLEIEEFAEDRSDWIQICILAFLIILFIAFNLFNN